MSNEVLFLSIACVVFAVVIIVLTFLQKRRSGQNAEEEVELQRPRGVPVDRGQPGEAPRRAGRNVRARMRAAAVRQEEAVEEEDDFLAEEIALPEGKIGAKKRKKLEMKAEKRIQRERELEEREERKQREKEQEEKRKKEEEKQKEEDLQKETEEKAAKEEKERQELEEYMKLKEAFEIEEEGYDEEENVEDAHKFQEFIDYIKEQKVIFLEDLASHFKLKTPDVISRVQDLLAQETLIGVIDDRGKFISITREELESVAQFIKQRGRVSISELAECSNTLINLLPDNSTVAS